MRISFCIIAYNEEKLIRQQLENLYPFAHEIIIVEGRTLELNDRFPKKKDRTCEIVKSFPNPHKKIKLFTREAWPHKNAMVALYFKHATGDYVWHVDCDEFYTSECIKNTIEFISRTQAVNYAHNEYYYYRYYNVVVAKNGTVKFWNRPARIHTRKLGGNLIHRPQILVGRGIRRQITVIPREVGIRHHYSIMDLEKVKFKAHFYGHKLHARYYDTYKRPIHELIQNKVCVRPDNSRAENSFPAVLTSDELEIPPGVDKLFEYYESEHYPWTIRG